MRTMTCEQFFNHYCDNDGYNFSGMIDEMFRSDSFSTDKLMTAMELEADERGISLSDTETFDSDEFFQNVYDNAEKGLS